MAEQDYRRPDRPVWMVWAELRDKQATIIKTFTPEQIEEFLNER